MRKLYTAALLLFSGTLFGQFDAAIDSLGSSSPYYSRPVSQFQNITWTTVGGNPGTSTITGYTTTGTVTPGTYSSTQSTASVSGGSSVNHVHSSYTNNTVGVYDANFLVSINETDNNALNDSATWQFEVSDSVYARERGNFAGGIGFTGATGFFGQSFEIFNQDTLTSISVRLQSPTAGDTIRFILYSYVNGLPGAGLDTSDILVIPTGTAAWYTVAFPCDVALSPGSYFVAAHQINTNNLGFGYSFEYYDPNELYYSTDGSTWTPFETAGFSVTLGIRLNLGVPTGGVFTYDLGPDTAICPSGNYTLNATQLGATYSWSTGATTPTINVSTAGTYTVTVSKCGISTTDNVNITTIAPADVNLGNDTSYCENDGFNYTITLTGTPGASYIWTGGDTGNTKTITAPGFYLVAGTLNGCTTRDTIQVTEVESLDPFDLGPDIDYCSDSSINVNLNVTNVANAVYNWNDGSTSPTKTVMGPGTYIVTVSQTGVCNETLIDTLIVTEQTAPMISLTDTFYCSGGTLVLDPGQGYDSYLWSTGETTETITINTSGTYSVTVATTAGCENTASALVSVRPGITVDLGADIDFWAPVTIDAGPGYASYLWNTGDTTQTLDVNVTGTYWVEVGSDQGCFARDTIDVNLRLGLNSLEGGEVTMYPNPTSGVVFLTYPGNAEELLVSVFSLDGKQIFQQEVVVGNNAQVEVDLTGNTPGVYMLRLEKDGESVNKRFILK